MDKREEFIQRLSTMLTRFNIVDKFGQMDTKVARLRIAEFAYNTLADIAAEMKTEKQSSSVDEAVSTYEEIQKAGEKNETSI